MSPPPITPNATVCSATQETERLSRGDSVVDDCHQRPGHRCWVGVLDDVASVYDAGRTLRHHLLRPMQDRFVGRSPAAANEHWYVPGDLDHAGIVAEVVRRIGLDHVGAELDGLPDERHDLLHISVDPIASLVSRLHQERLDHQRHANWVAGGAQSRHVVDTLAEELGLVWELQQVAYHAGGIEAQRQFNGP